MYATGQEVVLDDSLTQPEIALLRTVAVECFLMSHVVDSLVHSLDDCRTKRLGHIADAETDDISLRMCCLEGIHLLCYVGEEVVLLQLEEVFVNKCHIFLFFKPTSTCRPVRVNAFAVRKVSCCLNLCFCSFICRYGSSTSPSNANSAGPVM